MKAPFPAIVLCALVAAAADSRGGAQAKTADGREKLPIAPGPFQPDGDSLKQYKCPEWFRDAKFGIWDNPQEWISWKVSFKQPGTFKLTAASATAHRDPVVVVEIAGRTVEGKVPTTGVWDKFTEFEVGVIEVAEAGEQAVKVRPRDPQSRKAINVRRVKLLRNTP